MVRKQKLIYALGGFVVGVLLTNVLWLCLVRQAETSAIAVQQEDQSEISSGADVEQDESSRLTEGMKQDEAVSLDGTGRQDEAALLDGTGKQDESASLDGTRKQDEAASLDGTGRQDEAASLDGTGRQDEIASLDGTGKQDDSTSGSGAVIQDGSSSAATEPPEEQSVSIWDNAAVYTGGDVVSYQGCRYRARWWTQGEEPDSSDVWENLGIAEGGPVQPGGVANVPINAAVPQNTDVTDFKVVGYYPGWKPDRLQTVDFGILTHVCYAFAIPTADGGLLDLENPDTARALIDAAHENGAKVLLSVGGWSYNDAPLENVFMEATADEAGVKRLAENILAMCEEYGFDGVDMDWEHPRVDGTSAGQYESLMLALSESLHAEGKLLTAAVLSGATADGNVYYDAAAHTNAVLNAVDFINVMAYDGGDGERHSQYQFAVDCGVYWKETRGLPEHKVVLGVPFYARPSWADYGTILENVPNAYERDHVVYNGMEVYYNGRDTIAEKTLYARENLGGIMIWELTQDTRDAEKSLLQAIGEPCRTALSGDFVPKQNKPYRKRKQVFVYR